MRQERLKVLSLLEEQKITAEEASLLLDKLNAADGHHFISEETAEQVEEKIHRFAKSAENFAKEFGHKAAEAYKDVEPKLKRASQTILEKTAAVVDEIAHSLHETLDRAKSEDCCCGEKDDDTPTPN